MLKPIANLQSQLRGSNIRIADGDGYSTLLEAVQNRHRRHAKLENIPDPLPQLSLDGIRSALKDYIMHQTSSSAEFQEMN